VSPATPRRYTINFPSGPPSIVRRSPAGHPDLGRWSGRVLQGWPYAAEPGGGGGGAPQPPNPLDGSGTGQLAPVTVGGGSTGLPVGWQGTPVCSGTVSADATAGFVVSADNVYALRADLAFPQDSPTSTVRLEIVAADGSPVRVITYQGVTTTVVLSGQAHMLAGQIARVAIATSMGGLAELGSGTFSAVNV
jgi:hypothetical protein